jgi:phage baseplate assembly protein W
MNASPLLTASPVGWPLLPQPDDNGQFSYPSPATSVRQSIRVILSTRPGEQLMRPEFGAGLARFLEAPNTLATRRAIQDLIVASLTAWEPRITLDHVDVLEVADEPTHIRVELSYRIQRTGLPQQMGMSLQLGA